MFSRWRNHRRKVYSTLVITLIIAIFTAPYLYLRFLIPSEMNFLLGTEHQLGYFLPLQVEMVEDVPSEDLLMVDQSPIDPKEEIDISRPRSIQFNEVGNFEAEVKLFGIPIKKVDVGVIKASKLIPCGQTIGVEMDTKGILVLGLGNVKSEDGRNYQPAKGQIYTGDLIMKVDGQSITDQNQLKNMVEKSEGRELTLLIDRYGKDREVRIKPVRSKLDKQYRIGIWTRDDTQGIGTITYINPATKAYGALGHGITDIDTKELMPLKRGVISKADIVTIKKGAKGAPGEIEGVILGGNNNIIGDVRINSNQGIYGKINNSSYELLSKQQFPIGLQQDVTEGPAYILTDVAGDDKIQRYDVKITKVTQFSNSSTKGMTVEIVDEALLKKTNGIIQGMSGSPIIQNGKIIGAVTHVFVQNPAKGYGIYIENMLKKESLMD